MGKTNIKFLFPISRFWEQFLQKVRYRGRIGILATFQYIFRHCERLENDVKLNEPILETRIIALTTEMKIFPIITI